MNLNAEKRKAKQQLRFGDYLELLQKHLADEALDNLDKHLIKKEMVEIRNKMKTLPAPQVGRVFTLFFDNEYDKGFALPLRLARSEKDNILMGSDTQKAIEKAWLAVQHTCGIYIPYALFKLAFAVSDPAQFYVDGQSLGLSAAILIISQYFQEPIPGDVAFSARIEVNGQLEPVDYFEAKVAGAGKNLPFLKKIIGAKSQPISQRFKRLEIIHCSTLEEAIVNLWGEEFLTQKIIPQREDPQQLFNALLFYEKMQNNLAVNLIVDKIMERLKEVKRPSLKTIYAYALAEKGLQFTHDSLLEKAEDYFSQAKKVLIGLGENADPTIPVFEVFNKYGIWHTDNYRYDEAQEHFLFSLKWLENYHYPRYRHITTQNSLAQLYAKTGRHDQAEALLTQSLAIAHQTGEYDDWSRIYCYLAENSILAGQYEQAESYLDEADRHLPPQKPIQRLFNAFWRAMLYFHKNDAQTFARYLARWEKEDWFVRPQQNLLHVHLIKAYAVSLLDGVKKGYFDEVMHFFEPQSDVLTLLLLVQVDACHFLRHKKLCFLENNTICQIVQKAKESNAYLNKQLPERVEQEADWRALCRMIRF